MGIPGEKVRRDRMWDERANLIVSPVLNRRRWGHEEEKGEAADDVPAARVAEAVEAPAAADRDEDADMQGGPAGRRGFAFPTMDAGGKDAAKGKGRGRGNDQDD